MAQLSTHTITLATTGFPSSAYLGYAEANSTFNSGSSNIGSISSDSISWQHANSKIEACMFIEYNTDYILIYVQIDNSTNNGSTSPSFTTMNIGNYKFAVEASYYNGNNIGNGAYQFSFLTKKAGFWESYLSDPGAGDTVTISFHNDPVTFFDRTTLTTTYDSANTLQPAAIDEILPPNAYFKLKPQLGISASSEDGATVSGSNVLAQWRGVTNTPGVGNNGPVNSQYHNLAVGGLNQIFQGHEASIGGDPRKVFFNHIVAYSAVRGQTKLEIETRYKPAGFGSPLTDYTYEIFNWAPTTFGPSKEVETLNSSCQFDDFTLLYTSSGSETLTIDTNGSLGTKAGQIEYSINGGSYSASASATVNDGDVISLRCGTPSQAGQEVYVSITIGYSTWVGYVRTPPNIKLDQFSITTEYSAYNQIVGASVSGSNFESTYYSGKGTIFNNTLSDVFPTASDGTTTAIVEHIGYRHTNDSLELTVNKHRANNTWECLNVNNKFNFIREDATYSTHGSGSTAYTKWKWTNVENPFIGEVSTATDGGNYVLAFLRTKPDNIIRDIFSTPNPYVNSASVAEAVLTEPEVEDALLRGGQFHAPDLRVPNSYNMYGGGNVYVGKRSGCEVYTYLGDSVEDATTGARYSGRTLVLQETSQNFDNLYVGQKLYSEDHFSWALTVDSFYKYNSEIVVSYTLDSINSVNNIRKGDKVFGLINSNDTRVGNESNDKTNPGDGSISYADLIQIHPTSHTGRYFTDFYSIYFNGTGVPSIRAEWFFEGYTGPRITKTMQNSIQDTTTTEYIEEVVNLLPLGDAVLWNLTLNVPANANYSYAVLGKANCRITGDSFASGLGGAQFLVEPIAQGESYQARIRYFFPNGINKTFVLRGEVYDGRSRQHLYQASQQYPTTTAHIQNIEIETTDAVQLLTSTTPVNTGVLTEPDRKDTAFTFTPSELTGGTVHHNVVKFSREPNGALVHHSPIYFIPDPTATTWSVKLSYTIASQTQNIKWSGTIKQPYGVRAYDSNGGTRLNKTTRQFQHVLSSNGSFAPTTTQSAELHDSDHSWEVFTSSQPQYFRNVFTWDGVATEIYQTNAHTITEQAVDPFPGTPLAGKWIRGDEVSSSTHYVKYKIKGEFKSAPTDIAFLNSGEYNNSNYTQFLGFEKNQFSKGEFSFSSNSNYMLMRTKGFTDWDRYDVIGLDTVYNVVFLKS